MDWRPGQRAEDGEGEAVGTGVHRETHGLLHLLVGLPGETQDPERVDQHARSFCILDGGLDLLDLQALSNDLVQDPLHTALTRQRDLVATGVGHRSIKIGLRCQMVIHLGPVWSAPRQSDLLQLPT